MGANSLASFLTRLEMMRRSSENDKKAIDAFREIVDKLKAQKDELAEKKSIFDEKKAEVQQVRDEKQARKNELSKRKATLKTALANIQKTYNQVNKLLAQLDASSAVYQSYINNLQSERQRADAEIDAIIKKAEEERLARLRAQQQQQQSSGGSSSGSTSSSGTSSAPASSGSWGFPVGGSTYISSGFGNRSASISGWSFHGGIDIAGGGIYGRPIYASRGGTVITATYGTTGYGNYVILDHGDGYTTVYGHCSSLNVSTGQSVSKGQQIACVGSSGNSTGPHCHFEVRYNGVKQNPMNYL
ncbi:MAG: peptidoglycan DD-metalloendopeptidase family protein [Clostridia bacterium]|nr:peptidoglycan DD-metalloendopeptidase family protein [Clostridia bacterium]